MVEAKVKIMEEAELVNIKQIVKCASKDLQEYIWKIRQGKQRMEAVQNGVKGRSNKSFKGRERGNRWYIKRVDGDDERYCESWIETRDY